MSSELDNKFSRDLEQAEAGTESMAGMTAIFFNKLHGDGLTREEALQLTSIFLDNTSSIFRGPHEYPTTED